MKKRRVAALFVVVAAAAACGDSHREAVGTSSQAVTAAAAPAPTPTYLLIGTGGGGGVIPFNLTSNQISSPLAGTNVSGSNYLGLAVTPDGTTLFEANQGLSMMPSGVPMTAVDLWNLATGVPEAPIAVGSPATAVVVTPDGAMGFVSYIGGGITPIDISGAITGTPMTPLPNIFLPTPDEGQTPYPVAMAVTADGSSVYVVDVLNGDVLPITVATRTVGAPIPVGSQPSAIAITSSGIAYVTSPNVGGTAGGCGVTAIDVTQNAVVATIPVGSVANCNPTAIAATSDCTHVLVASANSIYDGYGDLTVIDTATNTAEQPTTQIDAEPSAIVVTSGNVAYVAKSGTAGNPPTLGFIQPLTLTYGPGTPVTITTNESFGWDSTAGQPFVSLALASPPMPVCTNIAMTIDMQNTSITPMDCPAPAAYPILGGSLGAPPAGQTTLTGNYGTLTIQGSGSEMGMMYTSSGPVTEPVSDRFIYEAHNAVGSSYGSITINVLPCGSVGGTCCYEPLSENSYCNGFDVMCNASNTCEPCGGPGQACCTGNSCAYGSGLSCIDNICQVPGPPGGGCAADGASCAEEPCCPSGSIHMIAVCESNHRCGRMFLN